MTIKIDQLADAIIAVPGVTVEIFNKVPGGTYPSGSMSTVAFQDYDASFTQSFEIPVAGVYQVIASCIFQGAGTTAGLRTRFSIDSGSQYLGSDDATWDTQVDIYSRTERTFVGVVTLSVGTHTITPQGKRIASLGGGEPKIDNNIGWKIQATLVSGSGAGGVIPTSAELSADASSVSSAHPTFADIAGLSVSITTCANETVLVSLSGWGLEGATLGDAMVRLVVDSTEIPASPADRLVGRTGQYGAPLSFTRGVTIATAGSHTIKIQGAYGTNQWIPKAGMRLDVFQYRGGLVPIRKDGYSITDTPAAIEFVGSGFQVSNSGGTAQIRFTQDTELPTLRRTGDATISVLPDFGEDGGITRITLQDGYQRIVSNNLSWDFANGVADLGLDTGAEAANTWYYLYLIPKSGNNGMLSVRASVTPPPVGLTGYSNWKYIGSFYNDAGSRIRRFNQRGSDVFSWLQERDLFNVTSADGSPVALPLTSFVPVTADSVRCNGYYSPGVGSYGYLYYFVDGYTSAAFTNVGGGNTTATNTFVVDIPLPNPPPSVVKQIYRQVVIGTGSINGCKTTVLEWSDGYL